MKETIVMFIDKVAFQLEKYKEGYTWVEQELQLENQRSLYTSVTVPETFLCDFKCRHKTQKCEKSDSRGFLWEAQLGQVARQPCPDPLQGYARFICLLCTFHNQSLGGNVDMMESF